MKLCMNLIELIRPGYYVTVVNVNPDPAVPGYALPLQTVLKKPTDLDLYHSVCEFVSTTWIK